MHGFPHYRDQIYHGVVDWYTENYDGSNVGRGEAVVRVFGARGERFKRRVVVHQVDLENAPKNNRNKPLLHPNYALEFKIIATPRGPVAKNIRVIGFVNNDLNAPPGVSEQKWRMGFPDFGYLGEAFNEHRYHYQPEPDVELSLIRRPRKETVSTNE